MWRIVDLVRETREEREGFLGFSGITRVDGATTIGIGRAGISAGGGWVCVGGRGGGQSGGWSVICDMGVCVDGREGGM